MNIFFYMEMKRKNENLIKQIEEIINSYDDVITYINNNCEYNYITADLLYFYRSLMLENKEDLKIIKEVTKLNDNKIYENCEHNFITDVIEIGPEKEKTICYCSICELTKRE